MSEPIEKNGDATLIWRLRRVFPLLALIFFGALSMAACGPYSTDVPPMPTLTSAPAAAPQTGGGKLVVIDADVTPVPTATPVPTMSATTGLTLEAGHAHRPILVSIGNQPQTRPQTGLMLADIIYELSVDRTDGNQTRLLALYSDGYPSRVGPVQSTRAYFDLVRAEWNGVLVCDSLPADAPGTIAGRTLEPGQTDAGPFFFSDDLVSSEPENMRFLRLTDATDALLSNDAAADDVQQHFTFQSDVTYAFGKPFEKVGLPFDGSDRGKIEFVFDAYDLLLHRYERNSKDALVASRTLTPNADGSDFITEDVRVQNLIVQYVRYANVDKTYREAVLVGSGRCDFFINGLHMAGTWSRPNENTPTAYSFKDGSPLILEPGTTWIALHPANRDIKVRYAKDA